MCGHIVGRDVMPHRTTVLMINVHAFMTTRFDYCNALLGGCSARLINRLQMVQNAAARVLTRTRKYYHISPVLSTLHWLPIKHRIDFKISVLVIQKPLQAVLDSRTRTALAVGVFVRDTCCSARVHHQFSLHRSSISVLFE